MIPTARLLLGISLKTTTKKYTISRGNPANRNQMKKAKQRWVSNLTSRDSSSPQPAVNDYSIHEGNQFPALFSCLHSALNTNEKRPCNVCIPHSICEEKECEESGVERGVGFETEGPPPSPIAKRRRPLLEAARCCRFRLWLRLRVRRLAGTSELNCPSGCLAGARPKKQLLAAGKGLIYGELSKRCAILVLLYRFPWLPEQ